MLRRTPRRGSRVDLYAAVAVAVAVAVALALRCGLIAVGPTSPLIAQLPVVLEALCETLDFDMVVRSSPHGRAHRCGQCDSVSSAVRRSATAQRRPCARPQRASSTAALSRAARSFVCLFVCLFVWLLRLMAAAAL